MQIVAYLTREQTAILLLSHSVQWWIGQHPSIMCTTRAAHIQSPVVAKSRVGETLVKLSLSWPGWNPLIIMNCTNVEQVLVDSDVTLFALCRVSPTSRMSVSGMLLFSHVSMKTKIQHSVTSRWVVVIWCSPVCCPRSERSWAGRLGWPVSLGYSLALH